MRQVQPAGGETPAPPQLTPEYLRAKVREALAEDLDPGGHDLTTEAVVPAGLMAEARLVAGSAGVVAGLIAAEETFRQVDPGVAFRASTADGSSIEPGEVLAVVRGRLRSLLTAERTALNFLQQLSGVATLTRQYVRRATSAGPAVIVLDTRKTVPGLRPLQRYAVRCGGGANHRYNLAEAVLIKDNHRAAAGGVAEAVRRARSCGLPVEVEVDDLDQLEEALGAGVETVLLDNLSPAQVAEAVRRTRGRAVLEVSGGVTLGTIAAYAATGVDRISVGSLTHSAPAIDISMEVMTTWEA
ncbi:MAG TPA: carboxylating nicotinate-nucleotide diphosphorylase [Candidatus Dormibacteraeota bacterium]|nr:carboxylating nicotinate-nucleotide diphosphorylase [Candidatus Dormibacteraeota bacterium]